MTDPSQYFKGRTVQEQMNEVIGYVDVRSAEVATTAIASDVAQVHQDMLDADADATAAAASAAAAAGTLANAVKKTGEASQSIAGDIAVAGTLSGGVVTGTQVTVPTPVNNTDAATKKYVDDHHDVTKISITDINSYAVGLIGNQGPITGSKTFANALLLASVSAARIESKFTNLDITTPPASTVTYPLFIGYDMNNRRFGNILWGIRADGSELLRFNIFSNDGNTEKSGSVMLNLNNDGSVNLQIVNANGTTKTIDSV